MMTGARDSYWLVAGGLNLDCLAWPSGLFRLNDSNPGKILERPGGVGFNLVRDMSRLGQRLIFLTARGDDEAGLSLFHSVREGGIDLSHALVRKAYSTSRYLAIHDDQGDMVAAINDMTIFDTMTAEEVKPWLSLGGSDPKVCKGAFLEPNLPADVLYALASAWQAPLFADGVSVAKVGRLRAILPFLRGLKVNRVEAAQLTGEPVRSLEEASIAARLILERGVDMVCLSLDVDGALFADENTCLRVCPRREIHDGNTTGAGDAMAAAFAWAAVEGYGLEQIARFGAAAAAITMESTEAVNPRLSLDLLLGCLEQVKIEVIK